jgi:hypothetical protein
MVRPVLYQSTAGRGRDGPLSVNANALERTITPFPAAWLPTVPPQHPTPTPGTWRWRDAAEPRLAAVTGRVAAGAGHHMPAEQARQGGSGGGPSHAR